MFSLLVRSQPIISSSNQWVIFMSIHLDPKPRVTYLGVAVVIHVGIWLDVYSTGDMLRLGF